MGRVYWGGKQAITIDGMQFHIAEAFSTKSEAERLAKSLITSRYVRVVKRKASMRSKKSNGLHTWVVYRSVDFKPIRG